MSTTRTFDANTADTRRIAQWLETALDGYFKDDIGRWAFRPLEEHIGLRDHLADDLCAIYDSLTASAQARWRRAICDVLAFHGRDISKGEATHALIAFAVLIRSPEVLDVLPGILTGHDNGDLLDHAVRAATALASQTDASRKCLERIRTSPAFTPDYAGLILVALCHADPDNWLRHVKVLAIPMRQLAGLLSSESTALRFYASSILNAISLKRISDANLNHLVSDSLVEAAWLLKEWLHDDDSLLCLTHDHAGARLALRTDDSVSVELKYVQYMTIARAHSMHPHPGTAIAWERAEGRKTWVAVCAGGILVELTCVESSPDTMSAFLCKYLSDWNVAQWHGRRFPECGGIAPISIDESLPIATADDLQDLWDRDVSDRRTDRVCYLKEYRPHVPHGFRRLAFENAPAFNATASALALASGPPNPLARSTSK